MAVPRKRYVPTRPAATQKAYGPSFFRNAPVDLYGKGSKNQPPPGWYDPTLDAQERAANRGLGDFRADTSKGQERADSDYSLGQTRIGDSFGRSLADLMTSRSRTLADTATAQQGLDRRYTQLGSAQAQAGNAAGLFGGGFLQAAARARAGNKGIEQAGLDTAASRAAEDSRTSETRLGVDKTNSLADLGLGYARGNEDRTTALARATRENTFFGQDTGAQRSYEAAQAGYIPPGPKPITPKFGRGGQTVVDRMRKARRR